MAMEHSSREKRGFATSLVSAGAPSGALLGTTLLGLFALLPEDQFLSWGWRVPFLFSAALLLIGLWVRFSVSETPIFTAALKSQDLGPAVRVRIPLWSVLRRPRVLILVTLATMAPLAIQTSMATFGNTYATGVGGLPRSSVLFAFSLATLISIFVMIGAGWLSDRWGRKPVIITGLALFGVTSAALFGLLGSGSLTLVALGFTFALICQNLGIGPLAAFIGEQFTTGSRYTGASLGYQLGTLLGAGFTPAILASLYARSGSIWPIVIFLSSIVAVSLIALVLTRETRRNNLSTVQH